MSELKARRAYFSEDEYDKGAHKICAKVSDCGYDRRNDWWSYAFEDEVYLKSEADKVISAKDAEIGRLHRCVIRMTKQWLSSIDDMYSRLDDVHGLDDKDVMDWDKVSDLHNKLDKVLEKWK